MRFIVIFYGIMFCLSSSLAQVSYIHLPHNNQLFPRNASDSADVTLSGFIQQQGALSAVYKLYRNGVLVDSTEEVLSFQNAMAPFSKVFKIKAEKAEYKVHFSLFDGQLYDCVLTVDSIVAGDVFIVNGQSNGAGPSQGPGAIINDEWVRTFGTSSFSDVDCAKDTLWGWGVGNTSQSNLAIGVWSMKLAKMLSDSLQIPICIINGSRFGSRIVSHLPNVNNHADLKTNYGRLLYRVNKAGVANAVKGLFWYQGESDGDTAHAYYAVRFDQLYNSWKTDFPGLNRIFIMQTRPGCVVGASYLYHQKIREAQRNFENQYSDISLMSTTAVPNFDGCHFLSTGYNFLASQLYFQVMRDVYGQNSVANIDPPNIVNATFVDSSNTVLAIKMSQPVLWPAVLNGNNLKEYFYFSNAGISVLNGWTSQDTVFLQLSSSSLVKKISYLPNIYYNGSTTQIFQGPWLMNSRSIGALAFYQADLSHQLSIQAHGPTVLCNGDSVLLTCNKNAFNFQWYKNGVAISNENSGSIWIHEAGNYVLRMWDAFGNDIESNEVDVLEGDAPVSIIASGTSICDGDSALLSINVNAGSAIAWSTGSNLSAIAATTSGWYHVSVLDSLGCFSEDSLELAVYAHPDAKLFFSSLSICDGDSARLYLDNNETGQWSNGAVDSVIYVKSAGHYSAVVTNSNGCSRATDTVFVNVINTSISIIPSGPLSTCSNQKITFSINYSSGTNYQWKDNGVVIQGATHPTFKPAETGNYTVSLTDSLGCITQSQPVMLTINKVPTAKYTLTNQANTCNDSLVTFTANSGTGLSYQWYRNGIALPGMTNKVFNSQVSGNYSVVVTNAWGCTKLSSAIAIPVPDPPATVQVMGNANICTGDSVKLVANSGIGYTYQWIRNNVTISGATSGFYYVKQKGFYKVVVTNTNGCSTTSLGKSITVGSCNITHRLSPEPDFDLNQVAVYPNPFSQSFRIEFDNASEQMRWSLIDITGRLFLSGEKEAHQQFMVINGNGLQQGMYFLILETPSQRRMIKLQKLE